MRIKKLFSLTLVGLMSLSIVTGCQQKAENTNTTIRVASWNIDSKAHPDIKKMSSILNENEIEIMGFQEIDILNGRNNYDMAADFVNENYPYVHFAKGRDFSNGGFGVGVTSKYELKEKSSIPIESTGSKATKTLERVLIEKEGKDIAFYVTHTSWENTDLRKRQISEIIERVSQDPVEYKIIVADWNADQSLFEYDLFKDNFYIANGKDDKWFDTFNGEDDAMKVFTVDNIICTKNMEIKNVNTVHTDMADHDMIYCDITLLDNNEKMEQHSLSLGQMITATTTLDDSYPEYMVDFNDKTAWKSKEATEHEIVVELDRVYSLNNFKLLSKSVDQASLTLSYSTNGQDYKEIDKIDYTDEIDVNLDNILAKFVKLSITSEKPTSLEIRQLDLYGDYLFGDNDDAENILINSNMENDDAWQLQVVAGNFSGKYDNYGIDDSRAYILTADNEEKDSTDNDVALNSYISQVVNVDANTKYQLSFYHKAEGLNSSDFTYEIKQLDKDGNIIKTHHALLNDNLNMSDEYRRFDYAVMTEENCDKVEIALHLVNGKGSLYLDNVEFKKVVSTETIFIDVKDSFNVGDEAKITANIFPENYSDLNYEFVTSDSNIIEVKEDGTLVAKAKGKAYVGVQSTSDLICESYKLVEVK